jgi:hypothetical protein
VGIYRRCLIDKVDPTILRRLRRRLGLGLVRIEDYVDHIWNYKGFFCLLFLGFLMLGIICIIRIFWLRMGNFMRSIVHSMLNTESLNQDTHPNIPYTHQHNSQSTAALKISIVLHPPSDNKLE